MTRPLQSSRRRHSAAFLCLQGDNATKAFSKFVQQTTCAKFELVTSQLVCAAAKFSGEGMLPVMQTCGRRQGVARVGIAPEDVSGPLLNFEQTQASTTTTKFKNGDPLKHPATHLNEGCTYTLDALSDISGRGAGGEDPRVCARRLLPSSLDTPIHCVSKSLTFFS